jgi:hypothetical protein
MLYKEWTTVRTKFLLWVLIYAGALGLFFEERRYSSYSEPMFQVWLGISYLLMAVVAALGGVDIIAEEKASSTLSFIMTRPISRARIYASKIGVNVAALAAACIPANLIVLVIDQLRPTPVAVYQMVNETCGRNEWCSAWRQVGTEYQSTNALQSLGAIGLILLFGIGIICLSGLISIFAANTIRAIFFTIPALLLFVVLTVFLISCVSPYYLNNPIWVSSVNLATGLILIAIAGGLFYGGLVLFKRKEF